MKKVSPGGGRRSVLWLGASPDALLLQELANRSFLLREYSQEDTTVAFSTATGIVFRFDQNGVATSSETLKSIASHAANHGLLVLMLADDDAAFLQMAKCLKELRLSFEYVQKVMGSAHEIAELFARHDPGPPEEDVEIKGVRVPDQTRLLLRRAFWDCKSISLTHLTEGRSADAYSVYALFRDSRVGPRPLPFFAKVDDRHKIKREWDNYQDIVGHFIPFHARPNLDADRCILGATQGILVGNFVENSESLWAIAKRGAAQPVIYSLFDQALRGWRLQAYVQDDVSNFRSSFFSSPMKDLFDPKKPILQRRAADATAFGPVRTPMEIFEILQKSGEFNHRVAPQHGDLHVKNVRASRGEAILIDFHSTQYSGPLVADPASLEVSLVFETEATDVDNEGWLAMVDTLYSPEYLHRAPPPAKEPAPREWLWACVRQVRLIALNSQTCENEYLFALILYLLRRASFGDDSHSDKYRRDYAYYLASRLTNDLVPAGVIGGKAQVGERDNTEVVQGSDTVQESSPHESVGSLPPRVA